MQCSADIRHELENDSRFTIYSEAMDSLFRTHKIYSWNLKKIAVGKIRRYKNKKLSLLTDTDNYRYLCNPESEDNIAAYQKYCNDNSNLKDNAKRSEEVFKGLINTFSSESYDPQKGIIVVDQYNCILDGLHRSCILLKQFGPAHEITVLQMKIEHGMRIKLLSPLFETIQKLKKQ